MSLKDFDIGKELGKGAFGSVCIVKRKIDNKTYAMKRVKISQLSLKEKENSLNEIRILASLSHNNIIGYKEAFFDSASQTLNIVMEYADDGDLASKIKFNKKHGLLFRENIIWDYLIQILNGLKFLHDNKIMHRDLKSANLFLMKNGTVKIGDLNVSKITKMGMAYTQTGTPYYASPEIWMDKPYDYKSDIWSVGCILYEMCMLRPPFTGTSLKNLCKNIQSGIYAPISKFYSRELSDVIKEILEVNPLKRPTCGELLGSEVIIKKIKEEGVVDVVKDNSKKAELMKTIKMPRNLKEINKALPMKRYNVKQREEMMENDEYETMKNGFYKEKKEKVGDIKELMDFFDVKENENKLFNNIAHKKPMNNNIEVKHQHHHNNQYAYKDYLNNKANVNHKQIANKYNPSPMNMINHIKQNQIHRNINVNHHHQVKTPNKYPIRANNIQMNNYIIHKKNVNLNINNYAHKNNNRPLSSINPHPGNNVRAAPQKKIVKHVPINPYKNRPYSGNNPIIRDNIISPHHPNQKNNLNLVIRKNNYLNRNKNRKVIIEKVKYQKPSKMEKAKEYERERMKNLCNNMNYYQNQYKQYIRGKKY